MYLWALYCVLVVLRACSICLPVFRLDNKLNVIIWKCLSLKSEFNMGTENCLIMWFVTLNLKVVRQQKF